jgi:non-specific serine/threonine protein kinase
VIWNRTREIIRRKVKKKCTLKTDGSGIDKINIITDALRQLSNHPKMIDKKSELDSGKYIAVTRYLKHYTIQ